MKVKQIAFFIKSFSLVRGGAERVLSEVINGLSGNPRLNVHLFSLDRPNAKAIYPLRPEVTWVKLNKNSGTKINFFESITLIFTYYFAIRQNNIYLSVGVMSSAFVLTGVASMMAGIPHVCYEHIDRAYYRHRRAEYFAVRTVMALSRANVFVSEDQMAERYRHDSDVLIQNFTSFPRCCRLTPKDQVSQIKIMSAGRLEKQKNFELCITVAQLLLSRNIDFQWSIFGSGSELKKLNRQIDDHQLNDHMSILPSSYDFSDTLLDFDVVVVTSLHESFGMVALEAIQRGVPVVAFKDLIGISKLIANNLYGRLVSRCDGGFLMADALEEISFDRTIYARKINAEREIFPQYTAARAVDQWTQVIEKTAKDI